MAGKAKKSNVIFRPHFKTHQSADVGSWFREAGADSITVSSISMAEYFAGEGWQDILVAFPVNILEIDKINSLSENINLSLLAESGKTIRYLDESLLHTCNIYVKIDTGYHRTGIAADDLAGLDKLIRQIRDSDKLRFTGFLTHSGHTYHAKSKNEIISIYNEALDKMQKLKARYVGEFPDLILSIGDTPACSLTEDFSGIDEIRPGNFVFYDVMQAELGSCNYEDIAAVLACPVVAKHQDRNEIVIYGGGIHLSKDSIQINNKTIFGLPVYMEERGWSLPIKDSYLKSLSQEHGIIKASDDLFNHIKIGDIIGILPVHSCLAVSCMREYYTLDGKYIRIF